MAGYVLVYMTETHTYRGKIQTQGAVTPWRNLPFLGFVACCTAGFSIIMTYVILAPDELMSRLNISPWNYGIITSANALFMGIFAILFSKIGQRIGAFSTLLLTLIVLATGGIGFIIGYNWHDIPSFIIFSAVISIGFGGLLGPASSLAMQPFSENKGQAAAILGASQLLGAAFVTTLLSHFQMISRLSLGTLTLILTGVCGLICFFLVRRFGKERLQNPLQSDISPHETVFAV
jgi:DHA1 family bicyclomycin/chloramphenicol resistance-like MFS transporter